jgi:hypothetical protein
MSNTLVYENDWRAIQFAASIVRMSTDDFLKKYLRKLLTESREGDKHLTELMTDSTQIRYAKPTKARKKTGRVSRLRTSPSLVKRGGAAARN